MKALMALVLLCTAVVASASSSRFYLGRELAAGIDAEERLRLGKSRPTDSVLSSRMLGYVHGVSDSMINQGAFCVPEGTTGTEMVALVGKFVRANPERWREGAEELVFQAIYPVFGCPPK